MSFAFARGLTAHIIAFTLVLQGFELMKLAAQSGVLRVWGQANIEPELQNLIPSKWTTWFARNETFSYLAYAEIILGAVAFIHPSALAFFLLLITHVLVCIRFRGSLNGGSDAMTAMVLLGAWISYLFKKESFASAGLVWISVNVLLSYGRAALAKIRQSDWRDGTAMPAFFQQSFFDDIRAMGSRLSPALAKNLGLALIAFEFALVFSPFATGSVLSSIFLIAILFHFANFWAFGLNRFFWAWIAAWPSIYFLSGLINHSNAQ